VKNSQKVGFRVQIVKKILVWYLSKYGMVMIPYINPVKFVF